MPDDSESLPASRIVPGPIGLRYYSAHNLLAWQPKGILDDDLLDEVSEWLCTIEKESLPFERFIDFSRLEQVAVRTNHIFDFARERAEQFGGFTPVKSALFSEDWIGFGIVHLYEELMAGTLIQARAFKDLSKAAAWLGVPVQILKLEDEPAPPH